jgi:hypothetical protein
MFRPLAGAVAFLLLLCFGLLLSGCNDDKDNPTAPVNVDNWKFTILSGDGQTVHPFDTLKNRLVVKLVDGAGEPKVFEQVRFELIAGDGQVVGKPTAVVSPDELNTITSWQGEATANFTCFSVVTSRVRATVIARPTLSVVFTIFGTS